MISASFNTALAAIFTLALSFTSAPALGATKAEKSDTKTEAKKDKGTKGDKKMADTKNPVVVVDTNLGQFEIELNKEKAPISVENFLKYVDDGHYNGTIFHRVISNFMIQGGGFSEDMKQKSTREPIKNEATNGLTNDKYTVAMARTNEINSATSQFFINVKDNTFLNHSGPENYGYAVFGKVTSGTDNVEKIKTVPTTMKAGHQDVPATPVVIKSIKRK